jgi:DNA adenine methylase
MQGMKHKLAINTELAISKNALRKPLLKWAGGKRWLVPYLQKIWFPLAKKNKTIRLVEPFTGGMSVALGLEPVNALLNDANEHLINFYNQVKKGLETSYVFKNNSEEYYALREKFNQAILHKKFKNKETAFIFYFLIRTGFNGLCRFNSSGEFNVPFGQHRSIRYKTDFLDYQEILRPWKFSAGDFEKIQLQTTDFLYADPPYDVEFTKYHSKDFLWDDQVRLAHWLSDHTGPVLASNQATPRIIELYKDLKFKVCTIEAPRKISCTGDRSSALEILAVRNVAPATLAALTPLTRR